MTILSTSAGMVAYDSRGSGDPIVLLPSGGHDHHDYDELGELLPCRLRSIGIDWPGHGRSPAGTAPSWSATRPGVTSPSDWRSDGPDLVKA